MAHTVGFGKLERAILSNNLLPADIRQARSEFKNQIRTHKPSPPEPFDNWPQVLPALTAGQIYYKYQVGQATAPTPAHPTLAGRRRLVAMVEAGHHIKKMYFTEDHYFAGTWKELQKP